MPNVAWIGAPIFDDEHTLPPPHPPGYHPMPALPYLIGGYLALAFTIAWFATRRGRSVVVWFCIALLITPVLAGLILWFLVDLAYEAQRTREFMRVAKQRRHRRDPHDTFSRTREQQEQEIQDKVITARMVRKPPLPGPVAETTRRLRALDNRTPATVIVEMM